MRGTLKLMRLRLINEQTPLCNFIHLLFESLAQTWLAMNLYIEFI